MITTLIKWLFISTTFQTLHKKHTQLRVRCTAITATLWDYVPPITGFLQLVISSSWRLPTVVCAKSGEVCSTHPWWNPHQGGLGIWQAHMYAILHFCALHNRTILGNFFCVRYPQYSSRWSKYHQPSDKRLKSCWRRCWREKLLNQPTTLGPCQLCLWERRMGQQGSVSIIARWTLSQETMHTHCCMWMTHLTPGRLQMV